MRITRRYLIVGRVQGVGFRYYTQSSADQEGVNGWVRNLPDGSVEVTADGEADAVERFERRLRVGPRGARVDHVETRDVPFEAEHTGFFIR
jgi:acylphosphatase